VEAQAFGISSTSGGQHAQGGTAFGPLKATVTEGGAGLPGAVVTFTAPDFGPGGFFGGNPTVLTDAAGVATAPTFTANFTPGTYAVRATAAANLFTDITLTNDPAAVGSLSLTGVPPSVQAGVSFSLTVTALKPDGTRDLGYAGTVRFTSNDTAATLPGPF